MRLFWAMLVLMAATLCAVPANATPADGDVPLENPCFLIGNSGADPATLAQSTKGLDCSQNASTADAGTIWVRYDLASLNIRNEGGWVFDHATTQAHDEQIWVGFADGSVRKSGTRRDDARTPLGGATQRFVLPSHSAKMSSLLIRVDGVKNWRSPVPRASLTSAQAVSEHIADYYLSFGVMGGIMLGILFYNFALYLALRYRVLIVYCAALASTLFYGIVGSNLILAIFPGMTTSTQFGWNIFATTLALVMACVYFVEFIEDGTISRRFSRLTLGAAAAVLAFSATRTIADLLPWDVFDIVLYAGYLAVIGLVVVGCFSALRRNSVAVRYFLLAWCFPVVVVVARIFWGVGAIKFENGAFDLSTYIALCVEALMGAIGLSWRLNQLRDERDAARDLADTDPLTSLLNRRAFTAQIGASDLPQQLILIDIDRFKAINDCFGHQSGDDVLVHLANILQKNAPPEASVGRLGGEEFGILLRADMTPHLAERLRRAIAASPFPHGIMVTASVGLAIGHMRDEESWRRLYAAADSALYSAKHSGRNAVRKGVVLAQAA